MYEVGEEVSVWTTVDEHQLPGTEAHVDGHWTCYGRVINKPGGNRHKYRVAVNGHVLASREIEIVRRSARELLHGVAPRHFAAEPQQPVANVVDLAFPKEPPVDVAAVAAEAAASAAAASAAAVSVPAGRR